MPLAGKSEYAAKAPLCMKTSRFSAQFFNIERGTFDWTAQLPRLAG